MEDHNQFSAADFVVFGGMLMISLAVGLFYAYKDRKIKSVENYYFGGRNMSPIPVGLSISVTFISSITVLGIPAHAYVYGTVIIWFGMCFLVQVAVACIYYIPLFQRLTISSVYEYLELRYHRSIRLVSSLLIVVLMIFYMGTTVYLTSLALSAVTPLSMAVSIILTAGICTLYTSIGGMKAVVWNDALQSGIMMAGIIAVMVRATILAGGTQKVWEAVARGDRDTFWTLNPDPTIKHSFWSIVVGFGFAWCSSTCTNQAITQRYQSCKSVSDARKASLIGAVPMILMTCFSAVTGCAMYAYFEGCDPVKSGKLQQVDQTVPYLVVLIFQDLPGMAGLFVAAAYSGMLSTVSSGINSLSALVMEDFILSCKPNLKHSIRLTMSKGLSIFFGIFTMILAFATKYLGDTVVQIVMTLFGIFGGPIFGLFVAGLHFPWTNNIGAGCGLVSGLTLSLWNLVGSKIYPPLDSGMKPFHIDQCPHNSSTGFNSTQISVSSNILSSTILNELQSKSYRPEIADTFYSITYLYLTPMGLGVTLIVALLVSFISGKSDPKNMDPSLFIPLLDNKIFPQTIRNFFRFGVPEYEEKNYSDDEEKKSLDNETRSSIVKMNLLQQDEYNTSKPPRVSLGDAVMF